MKLNHTALIAVLCLSACSSSGDGDPSPSGSSSTATGIGPEGGTVSAEGAEVSIGVDDLSEVTEIEISVVDVSDATLPDGVTLVSEAYAFTPHGTQFAEEILITIPYDSTSSDLVVLRLDDEQDDTWESSERGNFRDGVARFPTDQFSVYAIGQVGEADPINMTEAMTGVGPGFEEPAGLVLDVPNNRLLVCEPNVPAIYAVDLDTHDRTVVVEEDPQTSELLSYPRAIALDTSGGRFFVADNGAAALVSGDLETGELTLVSRGMHGTLPTRGMGPDMAISGLALDLDHNRIFVASPQRIADVDLTTGDRTVLSSSDEAEPGNGPHSQFEYVLFDTALNRLIAVDSGLRALVTIDTGQASGNRVVLSGCDTLNCQDGVVAGTGPEFKLPLQAVLDPDSETIYVTDENAAAVFAVDLASGDRTVFSSPGQRGEGDDIVDPHGIALDLANNRLFITDRGPNAVITIDLDTGDREIFSQEP